MSAASLTPTSRWTLALILWLATWGAVASAASCAPDAAPPTPPAAASGPDEARAAAAAELEARWGIRLESLDLSAGGFMVAMRYRVLDEAKARPLMERHLASHLVDKKTGAKLYVPRPSKLGELRSRSDTPTGHVFFILFANPGRLVQAGDQVAVVAGDFRADLVVDGGRRRL